MLRASTAILLLLVAVVNGQQSDEWITVVYEDQFGTDIDFYCNTSLPSNQPPNNSYPVRWMFNDLTNEEAGFNSSKYMISDDAYMMTILDVGLDDFGVYHCMMMTPESEWYLIKLGLNVRGPYYEDLWEKYRINNIIGLSAFLGFLTMAVGILIIYNFRWVDENEEFEEAKPYNAFNNPDYDANGRANGGYVKDKEAFDMDAPKVTVENVYENEENTVL